MTTSSPLWDGVREGCGSCEFGRAGKETQWTDAQGEVHKHQPVVCRRYPPQMVPELHLRGAEYSTSVAQHQPWLAAEDWCGEWRRKIP